MQCLRFGGQIAMSNPGISKIERGVGDTTKASSFVCVADEDRDDNQPPAPKYLDDGDNYPIVPINDGDHGHDHDSR